VSCAWTDGRIRTALCRPMDARTDIWNGFSCIHPRTGLDMLVYSRHIEHATRHARWWYRLLGQRSLSWWKPSCVIKIARGRTKMLPIRRRTRAQGRCARWRARVDERRGPKYMRPGYGYWTRALGTERRLLWEATLRSWRILWDLWRRRRDPAGWVFSCVWRRRRLSGEGLESIDRTGIHHGRLRLLNMGVWLLVGAGRSRLCDCQLHVASREP
jgi:hypothetical protein